MRSTAVRHVVHLRLTIVATPDEVSRDIVVDRELTLAHLRDVISAAFDHPDCRHYVFTDEVFTDEVGSTPWSSRRRRRGDRWTMIDFRDPTIIDSETVSIGRVLRDASRLFYAHTCNGAWPIRIDARQDDLVEASAPSARLVGGVGRAPLACSRGAFEEEVLTGILVDPQHPSHDALHAALALTVGPWATFEPDRCDLPAVRQRVAEASVPMSRRGEAVLDALVNALPAPARQGLLAHIAAIGLGLPVVVTTDDADAMTRPWAWLLSRARDGGLPLLAGRLHPDAVADGVDALDRDEGYVHQLHDSAKRLRLIYTRGGRHVVRKRDLSAIGNPDRMWSVLADAVSSSMLSSGSAHAARLLMLSIADGSLAEGDVGMQRIADALTIVRAYSGMHSGDGYSDFSADCDSSCQCPVREGDTWHDIVSAAIRDAGEAATQDGGGRTVASLVGDEGPLEAALGTDWVDGYAPYPSSRRHDRARLTRDDAARQLAGCLDLLALFGLARDDDGRWSLTPTLREFAKSVLASMGSPW